MSRMVQIRNMPDEMHRELKVRAALSGMSLSDYLLGELARVLERPTRRELMARIASRGAARAPESAARAVRRERERR